MPRADKQAKFSWTPVLPAILLVALSLLAWREYSHARARDLWTDREGSLGVEISDAILKADALSTELEDALGRLDQLKTERQGLADRAGNLEAQRDHLRADLDHQLEQIRAGETLTGELRKKLEEARLAQLEAERRPHELEGELEAARARLAGLEERLDQQARSLASAPDILVAEGHSSDGSVFALSGNWPDGASLPSRVLVCRQNGILLEGWIHRFEEGFLLGHARRWLGPVSALVKGEKVFILPLNDHEADYKTAYSQPDFAGQSPGRERMHEPP